jgi:valyl-tRNA synthetase
VKAIELDKNYNPKDFEDRIYAGWMENGDFKPADSGKDSFVIVIPPPNVTGVLHMGHGLNNSLQDILIRYNRMKGLSTLWVPGTDHAGIATQHVVEKRLKERGESRHTLGREKFLEETWKVKEEHHTIIKKQLQKIGASCDWSRERFTMDEGLSKAVREVFVTLYERDLLYKGEYLVNWCSKCGTALADDEVEHEQKKGSLYHIKYPYSDGSGFLTVATTRPETLFGDTAVAVNPEDDRYKALIGKTVNLPLTGRKIPVIGDSYCDMTFGSGAVKITPAHDPNDWEVGNRHNLEKINILNGNGTLNDNVHPDLRGLDVKTARKKTVEMLEAEGLLIKIDDHQNQVGQCYRCNTVIEPYMSKQWFVRMAPLAEKALNAWEKGKVVFYPKKWENTYTYWLRGIRDWCISRQLWWGHQIPAWSCEGCGKVLVLRNDPDKCSDCGGVLTRDPDVLDTWFSSWLWPFSTLGWPEKTADMKRFFPTSTLVTGYDIIFFWVARMIMASCEFMGQVPFRDVYITGLVRDRQGRKMSKSLGNGIDPLDVVDQYGADALKFTIAYLSAQGEDIPMDMETFKIGSKFCNKVWNATRYLLMNLEGRTLGDPDALPLKPVDKWIRHRLNETIRLVDKAMTGYRFDDMSHAVYDFFWNDFCDWYVEASKVSLYGSDEGEKDRAMTLLIDVLMNSLKLLHPFASFLTEEIWDKLPGVSGRLITASWPVADPKRDDAASAALFASLQEMVQKVRTIRSEFTLLPGLEIRTAYRAEGDLAAFFASQKPLVSSLIKASEFLPSEGGSGKGAVTVVGRGYEVHVFVREVIDLDKEIARMEKAIEKNRQLKAQTEKKLSAEDFVSRAPAAIIEKEKEKLAEFESVIDKMTEYLADLKN